MNKKSKLRQATLCFLIKEKQILLALKKKGFGKGKLNGVGGKVKKDETIKKAAIREVKEEIGVLLKSLKKVAVLDFYFSKNPKFNQRVFVFVAKTWTGNLKETVEMKPKWFNKNKLPFLKMWSDDKLWLPQVLKGERLKGKFLFDEKENVIDYFIKKHD